MISPCPQTQNPSTLGHRVRCSFFVLASLTFFGSPVTSQAAAESSPPTFQVKIERDVQVRMRDGIRLTTDLYIPVRDGRPLEGKVPAVLQRTPYNKTGLARMATFFAQHGYLSVIQDCRGRFGSEGDFTPFVNEPKDGHDTIVWLANHPACNGKVGMYGCSYMAWVQFQAATQKPAGLVTMIPYEGPTNAYQFSMRVGGALHLGLLRWVLQVAATSKEARDDPAAAQAVQSMLPGPDFLRWADRIPWRRGQTPLSRLPRYEDAAFRLYFDNPDYNEFWRQPGLGMDEYFPSFPDMPILWVVGWYDWYPRTICEGYQKMVRLKRHNQYLLVGPWTHNNFNPACGEVNFGDGGGSLHTYDDFLNLELQWFNRWLKDDRMVTLGEPVKAFVMGGGDGKSHDGRMNHGGRWHEGAAWPPADVIDTEFFLREEGLLSREKPARQDSSTTFTYDPRNTVSSNGRCIISYGPALKLGFAGMGPRDQVELETLPGHGMPGMPIASRPDVLVFQTPPLESDLAIAGQIKGVLSVSSDAPDTDFFVKLIDNYPASADYPKGFAFPVSEGILRARYRNGFASPSLLKPGQVYRLEIPLEPSANVFKAGHRIRVDICSSNFPNFDINRNTGDPNGRTWRVAHNTVWHAAPHPSALVLPLWSRPKLK